MPAKERSSRSDQFPRQGFTRSQWFEQGLTKDKAPGCCPGFTLERNAIRVARQTIKIGTVEAGKGLEFVQRTGGIKSLGVHLDRSKRGVAAGAARGVLFQGMFYPTWSHQQPEMDILAMAFDQSCGIYRKAIDAETADGLLIGRPAKAVFRKKILEFSEKYLSARA